MSRAQVQGFFHEDSFTVSYLLSDPETRHCAVVDPVLDFDPASGRTGTTAAGKLAACVEDAGLELAWILETHVHADHLSAAPWLQERLGGQLAIGAEITAVQRTFGELFNAGEDFPRDGSQFDRLLADGDRLALGALELEVLHTPGHTPACVTFLVGDAAFVGDTLFMPDYGTARADFPGGDAHTLYRSIRRVLSLPPETRLFMCHDYQAPGRDHYAWESTVAAQRAENVHVRDGISEDDFVALRQARDATLALPRLMLPAVQVNMRAGRLPAPESNGRRYLKLPVDAL